MKEYLVFVPVGKGVHIAGVTTVPDDDVRGVVVITTGGGGVPRSHRYRLWTKVARRLAERNVASLRVEWPGVGDSTGDLNMSFSSLPVDEIASVARFAMDATGTSRLGLLGNCGGARTVLEVGTSRLNCESMALLLLKPLARRAAEGVLSRRIRGWASARAPRWLRDVARLVRRMALGKGRRVNPVLAALEQARGTSDVLLLEPKQQQTAKMKQLVASGRRNGSGRRFELENLPGPTMQDFDSVEDQTYLVETLVSWFDASFSRPSPDRLRPRREPAAAGRSSRRRAGSV